MKDKVLRVLAVGEWNYLMLEGKYFYEVYECRGDVCHAVLSADRAAGPIYFEAFNWAAELLGFETSPAVEPSVEPLAYGPYQLLVSPAVVVMDGVFEGKLDDDGWALYRVGESFYAAEKFDNFFHVAACEVVSEDYNRVLRSTNEANGSMDIFCESVLEVHHSKAKRRYFGEMWKRVTARRV